MCIVCVQCVYIVCIVCVQCVYSMCTVCVHCVYIVYIVCVQCVYSVCTVCVYIVCIVCVQHVYSVCTVCVQCVYSVCTVCVWCGECISPFDRLKQRRCSLKARVPLSVSDSVCGYSYCTPCPTGYFNIRIPIQICLQALTTNVWSRSTVLTIWLPISCPFYVCCCCAL